MCGFEIAFGQPGHEAPIRRGRRQPESVIPGEDLLHHDRHRPTIEHDVVIGQHEAVPVVRESDERGTEGGLLDTAC
jgi:hypothetical protein